MCTYTIEKNTEFGSLEVYFTDKPDQMIRDALKLLRFRWHGIKKCWYGFADETKLRDTIINASADQNGVVVTDGYLGATAVYGTKSNRRLYGSDLSAAIRQEFKAAGLKGVTVKCKTYSGGQHLTITVNISDADFVGRDEYIAAYRPSYSMGWIPLGDHESMHVDEYFALDPNGDGENIRRAAAAYAWKIATIGSHQINHYHLDKYTEYTAAMLEKLRKINEIIAAYRYDDSNSQVDYFNTNFYYTIYTQPAKA